MTHAPRCAQLCIMHDFICTRSLAEAGRILWHDVSSRFPSKHSKQFTDSEASHFTEHPTSQLPRFGETNEAVIQEEMLFIVCV